MQHRQKQPCKMMSTLSDEGRKRAISMTDLSESIEARYQARKEREERAVHSIFNAMRLEPTSDQAQRVQLSLNYFAAESVQVYRLQQEADLREKLARRGVEVTTQPFNGDSAFPTEYTVKYGEVQALGPTLDLALAEFLGRLLPSAGRK